MLNHCLIFTFSYAIIETVYRQSTSGKITTLGQTIMTFIWTPILVKHFQYIENQHIAIILFPINIWICELFLGYASLYLFNNRFWYYDDELALFNGLISLSFTHYWLGLGIAIKTFLEWYPEF